MDAKLKLALVISVVTIGAVVLALLAAVGKYLISIFIFIVLIGLVFYLVKLVLVGRYQTIRITYDYEFLDAEASVTKISKSTVLIPRVKDITEFDDLGIGPDGHISSVSTNNGTPTVRNNGGSVSVTTVFDTALPLGQEYTHELSYLGNNCFPGKEETVAHSTIQKMDEAIVSIKFHEDKRPLHCRAVYKLGSKAKEAAEEDIEISDLNYVFTFKNPPRSSVFELEWEW